MEDWPVLAFIPFYWTPSCKQLTPAEPPVHNTISFSFHAALLVKSPAAYRHKSPPIANFLHNYRFGSLLEFTYYPEGHKPELSVWNTVEFHWKHLNICILGCWTDVSWQIREKADFSKLLSVVSTGKHRWNSSHPVGCVFCFRRFRLEPGLIKYDTTGLFVVYSD